MLYEVITYRYGNAGKPGDEAEFGYSQKDGEGAERAGYHELTDMRGGAFFHVITSYSIHYTKLYE